MYRDVWRLETWKKFYSSCNVTSNNSSVPLHQLKSVRPSTSTVKPAEKYIQVISVDDHELWFIGFLN
ncbi:hypothetical protein BRARA_A00098 [Brassica rapa]|uniref:Uncharacterized protein n=1 Tax=Brassica campestris TaxID=3711 RepID=A0A398ANG2_BRACM|nr:hypothetical protein BRARA_A00098 [Brassica rapa]